MEDLELLLEYAERQSEQAFTQIVHRHVNLVFSIAVRLVEDGDLAKDVVQMVFVDLAGTRTRPPRER